LSFLKEVTALIVLLPFFLEIANVRELTVH
jgi:hypothetical protein